MGAENAATVLECLPYNGKEPPDLLNLLFVQCLYV